MKRLLLTAGVSAFVLASLSQVSPARAQATPDVATAPIDGSKPAPVAQHLAFTLQAGTGRLLHLDANVSNVFAADPKVVEVKPGSPTTLFAFGVAPGKTTVAALTASGDLIAQYEVTVVPNGFDAGEAEGAIARSRIMGGVTTQTTETGVTVSGDVETPGDAERAIAAAKGVIPPDATVENHLQVDQSIEVGLHVRIAEMSRTLTRELGVQWKSVPQLGSAVAIGASTGNTIDSTTFNPSQLSLGLGDTARSVGADLTTVIDALSDDNLVHTLAEPNLTTMSGQPASFLVGGEFPIPVGSGENQISISFKQYGISLSFVPTVISSGRISLHVRPEISALDEANAITSYLGGGLAIKIPALTVRRADTTVELGSGQSFAIAGLLSDETTQDVQAVPGLGDMPVLGALFRSDNFQRKQTELVIVVTPYIVRPISDPSALHLPTDGYSAPTDLERILEGRFIGRNSALARRRIPADAGFVVE